MGADRWDEQVGSVADEATRLLEALRRAADDAAAPRTMAGDAAETPATSETSATSGTPAVGGDTSARPADGHDPTCTWCPLCRSAAVLRSLSPETLVRLADLAGVAASVLTDLARSRSGPGSGPQDATTDEDRPTRSAARPSTAEARAIPVLDADDPQEAPRG